MKKRIIVFRVDSSTKIGTGHVSRCLTLAKIVKDRGAHPVFICADSPGNMVAGIQAAGFPVDLISAARNDAEQTLALLKAYGSVEALVVDHYGLNATWERKIRPAVSKIVVIDDLADRPHECDVLVDCGVVSTGNRYAGLLPISSRRLMGPKYALLREEFRALHSVERKFAPGLNRVVVSFGGVDMTRESFRVLAAVKDLKNLTFETDVFTSSVNPALEDLKEAVADTPRAKLHIDTKEMAKYLAAADLAIGAGGISAWERCCVGVPTLMICIANNQEYNCEKISKTGAAVYLGKSGSVTPKEIGDAILHYGKVDWRRAASKAGRELVDGQGASRVATEIVPLAVEIRIASAKDSERVYSWRNHDKIRSFMIRSERIERTDHEKWFKETLANPNRILLIGEMNGVPVGVIRFDLATTGHEAEVGIYVDPEALGRGLGSALLQAGENWLSKNSPRIDALRATVKEGNERSQKLFARHGYEGSRGNFKKRLVLS